jgi:F-type H+-transporting ATPase subunit b
MMMKKLIVVAALLASGTVYAQPAESEGSGSARPDHGFAPPSDEGPPTNNELPGVGATEAPPEGTGHVEHAAHGDPTKNFNFAGDWWSYHGKDQYGGPLGDGKMIDPATGQVVMDPHDPTKPAEEETMSPPFLFMVLNFLILLALLVWKGGPIVGKLAAERHDQIKGALDEAAKLRQQAADKLAEYESKLKDADSQIAALVEGMKKDAEADKVRILENAERQAAQMKKDAEARIAAEIELARAQLTREVTAAAAAATEKLLREKMQPGDQAKLVGNFISNVQERA